MYGGHNNARPTDRWDFFISYTQADLGWAEWIAWQLEESGFGVLVQAWDMVPGSNWAVAMDDGVRYATRTLAVLSDAYLRSVYGRQEWQAAVAADPDSARRKLLPVRVEDCACPGLLGQVVSFDVFGLHVDAAREELLARVRAAIAGRAKPHHEPRFPGPHAAPIPRVGPHAAASPAFPGTPGAVRPPDPTVVPAATLAVPQVAGMSRTASGPEKAPKAAEFHALLIGVGAYEDDRLPALPWLSGMLDTAAEALETAGYRTEIHDRSRSGAGALKAAVHGFLSGAAPGDNLLIVLAGNGVHNAGRDFLVPADATVGYQPFWDLCVPVDWAGAVARSAAGQVLVLVDGHYAFDDAVRELISEDGWGGGRLDPAPGTELAYLFYAAASEGLAAGRRVSTAQREGTAAPSLTRSLVDILSRRPLPASLAELRAVLDRSLADAGGSDLYSGGHPEGTSSPRARPAGAGSGAAGSCVLRPVSSCDPSRFRPFPQAPASDSSGIRVHPWLLAAGRHSAWERVADAPVADELRAATSELIGRLGHAYDAAAVVLADDPWHDPDLARRFTKRVEFLVGRLPADSETLSPAEAALLVAGPYLHQTVWTILVARETAAHPRSSEALAGRVDRGEFEAFTRIHPRLVRRIERARISGDQASAAAVGWWLVHQWSASHATTRWGAVVRELLAGLGSETIAVEVFRAGRLAEILTALRAQPTFLNQFGRDGALRDLVTVAPATSEEMVLHERLVGYLLAIGQRMALELAALPNVLVEHLGVADAVDLTDVLATLRRAEWQGRGRSTRALAVECRHQALQVALERHTAGLDALLAEAHRVTAEIPALSSLPTHATADGVRAVEVDGHAAYSSAGAQFRLAEDRVQELLMGEQLYENRALAVRELYQNALDACRYRRARVQYLERTTGTRSAWSGEIEFQQGFESDGTPYIECRDNGVGMGYREISDVFAEAGTRTVDLPEVVEEMARWAACDSPIEFHPNSRFGVGVLSYFMIADEIRVETCRIGFDGRPGDLLRVTIAGPGNLFRIENLGPGVDGGTSVRLYLSRDPEQPSISCVDVLRRILWVAEFETSATEGAAVESWPAGRLADSAPVGDVSPLLATQRRSTVRIVDAGDGVWWCDGVGAILADGLWVGEAVFGVVVNLTGPLVPDLSVDRNKIRDLVNEPAVDTLLSDAVPALRGTSLFDVSLEWLAGFSYSFPLVADTIVQKMAVSGESWLRPDGYSIPVAHAGFLATDPTFVIPVPEMRELAARRYRSLTAYLFPDSALFARLESWSREMEVRAPDISPDISQDFVLPSDFALLGVRLDGNIYYRSPGRFLTEVIYSAALLRCAPQVVGRRLDRLGLSAVSMKGVRVSEVTEDDRIMLSTGLDGTSETRVYRIQDDVVRPGQVAQAANRLMMSYAAIARRFRELGLEISPAASERVNMVPLDLVLLSERLDGRYPWLSAGTVSLAHVLRAALYADTSVAEVCASLEEFGYRAPRPGASALAGLDSRDIAALGLDENGALGEGPVPTSYLAKFGSGAAGRRLPDIGRLRDLGFPVARTVQVPQPVSPSFPDLFPDVRSAHPLWSSRRPIDRGETLMMSQEVKLEPTSMAAWCRTSGYVVAAAVALDDAELSTLRKVSPAVLQEISDSGRCELVHVLGMLNSAGVSIGECGSLFERFGIAVPAFDGVEISAEDEILLSAGLDGNLDLALVDNGMRVAHLVDAATRLRREPRDLADRARHLGIAVADPLGWDATPITPLDTALLARDFGVTTDWLPDGLVTAAHVLRAAARTGNPPRLVAQRLRELGHEVADVADVDLTADEDRILIDLLDIADEGSPGHGWAGISRASILATAFRRSRSPAELADWVASLGEGLDAYAGRRFPDSVRFEDVDLLSWTINGEPPWLPHDVIGRGHILAAAGRIGWSPERVAGRLREMGFVIDGLPEGVPSHVDAVDVNLMSRFLWGRPARLTDDNVPLRHIYYAACVLSCEVGEIRHRLDRLGFSVPAGLPEMDRTAHDLTVVLCSHSDNTVPGSDSLCPAEILGVAEFIRMEPRAVRESFASLGLRVPVLSAREPALAELTARDTLLLSTALDGRGPWLRSGQAPLAHVIAAAGYFRWNPQRVADRLSQLNCEPPRLPEGARNAFVDGVDRALVDILTDVDGNYQQRPISRAEVLAASFRFRWTPARVAERMIELGFEVPSASSLPGPERGATAP